MTLPTYSVIILIGILVIHLTGCFVSFCRALNLRTFYSLELTGGIAAYIGAKIWWVLVHVVEQKTIFPLTLESFMQSGLSFYGGFLLGASVIFLAAKIRKIKLYIYTKNLLFLVPLFHAFWKFGCLMGGCCYGIPYAGIGAITFPEGVPAPAGIKLFPVQLLELACLLLLSLFFYIKGKQTLLYPIRTYILFYATVRFFLEFLRTKPRIGFLSVAQYVSLGCILAAGICFLNGMKKHKMMKEVTKL
jgi:phosphatidylglycerol:prolipoprotein diacylglycerol transferase